MTALLTDNLPLLAGAPNGIKKLRELILELAVRGKLVPQDPSDEPASELLKRIAEEKARLVAEGKIKNPKPLTRLKGEDRFDDLPEGWALSRLGEVVNICTGKLDANAAVPGGEYPFFTCSQTPSSIATYSFDTAAVLLAGNGDFNLKKFQGRFDAYQRTYVIEPVIWSLDFCFISVSAEIERITENNRGSAIPYLKLGDITNPVIWMPPLAEQHRIVAKVDELMALCDCLEARQADAESAHAQLLQALLDSLTQASDATDFAANWQRLTEHFHTLFTTEPSIDALKQTLLQLAVMGKLVPQDPSDEPASELLKRITEEKARLVSEGKIKKQKALSEIGEEERAFELPQGWQWARKAEVFSFLNGYAFKSEWFRPEGIRLLRNVNVSHGAINWKETACISEEQAVEFQGFLLAENDVVLTLDRPIISTGLKYAVIRSTDLPCLLLQRVAKIAPYASSVTVSYLSAWLNSRFFVDSIDPGRSNGVPHISTNQVANMPFALPPLAEQHRIVAKVDQLMALCDQLKTRLTQARQLNEQLASTLVERALVEDGQQSPAATDQKAARTLLAAEITHQLHGQRTFGQRKLQKVIYLAEHAARLAAVQGNYLRDAAGPHDRQLMNQVESELYNRQWYECIDRETFGHAYRPLAQAGQHQQAFDSAWSTAERATIKQVIDLMRDWDTDRCEMTVTLYAAWNDFILEGRQVTDAAIVDDVMHSWNDAKLRFDKGEWLAVLTDMKKHELLIPNGFGQRTTGGMLSLPGFE